MKNRKIDKKLTFQVVIDIGWRKLLTHLRAEQQTTIRDIVETALSETYGIDKNGKPYVLKEENNI